VITVVTVTYSPGEALTTFLDSLERATAAPVEVVLADNGSDDGSVEIAAKRPGVRIVPTGGNVGYGRAVNVGVGASTGELVVIANPDVIWEPDSLDELVAAAQRWPGAGSIGPMIKTPSGAVYPSARALPSLGRGIGHALCGWWWPSNPWTAAYRRERGELAEGPTDWLSGSCMLVRRAAFDAVAGFDPAYFMYFEDVDLGERLGKAGWQNVYVPSAVVVHTGGHATSRDPERMAVEHHHSAWIYIANRYRGRRWAPVRWMLRAGLAGRAILAKRVRSVAEGAAPQRHT
jgi:N-acetylglucosaminyl-diphospho-decaprenol L-rhamnosyltransferase